jgi:hypothetical protein
MIEQCRAAVARKLVAGIRHKALRVSIRQPPGGMLEQCRAAGAGKSVVLKYYKIQIGAAEVLQSWGRRAQSTGIRREV